MNSKAVLLSGVVLLLVGALAGYFYGVNSMPARTTSTVTTVPTVPDAYDKVASSYANHLLLVEAKNTSELVSGYETNATVEWKGYSGGCDGNYTGSAEIAKLLGALLRNDGYILVSNETQTIRTEGNYWVVDSTFHFAGNSSANKNVASPFVGTFKGAIAAQDSYVNTGRAWLITSETWNFLYYDSSPIEHPISYSC